MVFGYEPEFVRAIVHDFDFSDSKDWVEVQANNDREHPLSEARRRYLVTRPWHAVDMATTVYTDGACIGNPGPGGWAWAVPDGPYASGAHPGTTNQRMELTAALEAIRALPGPLQVVSDSEYVVKCFHDRWYVNWEAKGWRNSKKKDIENQDLWKPMVSLFHKRGNELTFTWVKGHADDPMNDIVDRLANEAARTQVGRTGTGQPTNLGPVDTPTKGRQRAQDAGLDRIGGWRLVILGHRPPQLGGYEPDNPVAVKVRAKLAEIMVGLRAVHPDLVLLTGLGLGAETLGAESAQQAGVPYVVVLAYPDPDSLWPPAARERYRRLAAKAADVVTLSSKQPRIKQQAGMATGRRNDGLVAAAHGAIVVWDGADTELGRTVASLEKRVPDDVWVVSPT